MSLIFLCNKSTIVLRSSQVSLCFTLENINFVLNVVVVVGFYQKKKKIL